MYKCELPDCNTLTDGALCSKHKKQAESEDYYITVCQKCNSILKITKKKIPGMAKYIWKNKCPNDGFLGKDLNIGELNETD
jgi:hypothetical protein